MYSFEYIIYSRLDIEFKLLASCAFESLPVFLLIEDAPLIESLPSFWIITIASIAVLVSFS